MASMTTTTTIVDSDGFHLAFMALEIKKYQKITTGERLAILGFSSVYNTNSDMNSQDHKVSRDYELSALGSCLYACAKTFQLMKEKGITKVRLLFQSEVVALWVSRIVDKFVDDMYARPQSLDEYANYHEILHLCGTIQGMTVEFGATIMPQHLEFLGQAQVRADKVANDRLMEIRVQDIAAALLLPLPNINI